ncbi:MAG: hypothetical protein ACLP5H_11800 [Desulfomonilaceae bacterium]
MRKLFIAMILATLAASSAQAQLAVAPEGGIISNGALHYTVPSGIPIVAWGGQAPWPSHFPATPLYPLSYPMVPVPIPPPSGSTSDRIKPPDSSQDKSAYLRPGSLEADKLGMSTGHQGFMSFSR